MLLPDAANSSTEVNGLELESLDRVNQGREDIPAQVISTDTNSFPSCSPETIEDCVSKLPRVLIYAYNEKLKQI